MPDPFWGFGIATPNLETIDNMKPTLTRQTEAMDFSLSRPA